MRFRAFLAAAIAAIGILLATASAQEPREGRCPACGTRIAYEVLTTKNDGGGQDSDGCRWSIGSDGHLLVPELREIVACPSSACGAAFYRAHFESGKKLTRRGTIVPAVADLGTQAVVVPAALTVARAIATYRAYGLENLGSNEDARAFEGRLWLRAAWALREAAVGEDDVRQLPFLFAPKTPEEAKDDLEAIDAKFRGASSRVSPVDGALAGLDDARLALGPLEPRGEAPSRGLAYERALAALDQLERTLLTLRSEKSTNDEPGTRLSAREIALALARVSLREGDIARRDRWLTVASQGHEVPEDLRAAADRFQKLSKGEVVFLRNAWQYFYDASKSATGARQYALLALAADAARRVGELGQARTLAEQAALGFRSEPASPASRLADLIKVRLGG